MDFNKSDKSGSKSQIAAKFQYGSTASTRPPIGVFWDIENCQVPKGRSATALVQNIRERFFKCHREAEFMCVCDISKESREVIHELNMAQVTVVHINAISKNAADDKLKQCMRRFVDIHGSPSTVVLISADVNFSTDLSDFRHRRNVKVILIHSDHAPEPLLACAHQHFSFEDLISTLPYRSPAKGQMSQTCELLITELPAQRETKQIQHRLKQLSDNCGGKVLSVVGSTAILRFPSPDAAQRARKRMDKEDVYGNKISVSFSPRGNDGREGSPHRVRRSRSGIHSNPGSGSSRESSPVLSTDSSQSSFQGNGGNQPAPDLIHYDRPDSTKRSLQSSNSGTFLVGNGGSKKDDPWTKKFETLTIPSVSPSNIKSCENSSSVSGRNSFENKSKKTPQKNIGRVSPFMKSVSGSGQCPRDIFVHTPRSSAPESFTTGGRLNSSSPASRYSPSSLREQYSPHSWSDYPVNENVSASRHSPCLFGYPVMQPMPVELLVTNLDQNVQPIEMKKILLAAFREHVMVLHISMLLQPDGSFKSVIKVPSIQDAQFAISQLHRKKIGFKRILISYTSNDRVAPLHILKSEVLALLGDIPARKMPLFKFRELFENRYHRSVGISELYKLQEVIQITEDPMGRMVSLNPDYRNTPSPIDIGSSQAYSDLVDKSFCEQHFQMPESQGWAEMESVYPLPDVYISLKMLSPRVHTLLDTHQGCLPLNSFCACYKAEFGPLPMIKLNRSESAGTSIESSYPYTVPLEHLIACIPGVQITHTNLGIKKVQWLENKTMEEQSSRCISPALVGQLLLFGKEIIDLIKSQPRCSMPFSKFIPTYHHHFGRQCRVADYGFTKLVDLLEAMPHIVQLLGQGQSRTLTLTHRCQVKRFSSDLLRVLKSLPSKQLLLSEFSQLYEQCLERPFDISHYGVCQVTDILPEVSDNILVTMLSTGETLIAIPKREQTPEEIELTKEFSREVLELLRHTPNCSMTFSKFIPSYHHHFGRQCRVSDYGFSKLVELFEAIPLILEVHGSGEEKILKLTSEEKLKVLAERIRTVVRSSPQEKIWLDDLPGEYLKIHGYALHQEEFGSDNLQVLLNRMKSSIKVSHTANGPLVTGVDRSPVDQLSLRVRQLLMEQPQGRLSSQQLSTLYLQRFKAQLNLSSLHGMEDGIKLEKGLVKLTSVQLLARDIITLLHENGGHIAFQNFEAVFLNRFGGPCRPAHYGFSSLLAMLSSFPDYLQVKGRRGKKAVLLIPESTGFLFPSATCSGGQASFSVVGSREHELLLNPSPMDLLSQPIPSSIPSPEIHPELEPFNEFNLMGFESPMQSQAELICGITENEQQQLRTLPLNFPLCSSYSAPSLLGNGSSLCPIPPRSWLAQSPRDNSLLSVSFSTDNSESTDCPNSGSHESVEGSDSSLSSIPGCSSQKNRPLSRIAAHFTHSPRDSPN